MMMMMMMSRSRSGSSMVAVVVLVVVATVVLGMTAGVVDARRRVGTASDAALGVPLRSVGQVDLDKFTRYMDEAVRQYELVHGARRHDGDGTQLLSLQEHVYPGHFSMLTGCQKKLDPYLSKCVFAEGATDKHWPH
eukprot:TRINITY_DN66356_c1_g13_i2.p2 TRINITY_DN66356_c1_g13~~TRINITY_DN66356_c1_g13_i2.p2  ORF type:complete len:136 (-),score=34.59 TRINITY_DN66356_c1_g13_i2:201-608(-)